MAGSQDSEKRQPRVSQESGGSQEPQSRGKAQCKDGSLERSVAEPGAGAGGRGSGGGCASFQPGCQKEEEGGQRVEVEGECE